MLLFIDACVREQSRTRALAHTLLEMLQEPCEIVRLTDCQIPPLNAAQLSRREAACQAGDFSAPDFAYAKQFAAADTIVIAAPYWDLSFPAILKQYLEAVCVANLTFRYSEQGQPVGLCRAKRLFYVTTAGGALGQYHLGWDYVKALAETLFQIPNCQCFAAEHLDDLRFDAAAQLELAKNHIRTAFSKA